MRGKGDDIVHRSTRDRITPAYAGKSETKVTTDCKSAGSPPPMRGKGTVCAAPVPIRRITPAYAGKRCAAWQVEERL